MYANLVAALKEHMCPKPLVMVECFHFHKKEQVVGVYTRLHRQTSQISGTL